MSTRYGGLFRSVRKQRPATLLSRLTSRCRDWEIDARVLNTGWRPVFRGTLLESVRPATAADRWERLSYQAPRRCTRSAGGKADCLPIVRGRVHTIRNNGQSQKSG